MSDRSIELPLNLEPCTIYDSDEFGYPLVVLSANDPIALLTDNKLPRTNALDNMIMRTVQLKSTQSALTARTCGARLSRRAPSTRCSARGEVSREARLQRRSALLLTPIPLLALNAHPAHAVRDGPPLAIDPIQPFSIEDFSPEDGWTELDSGLIYKVLQKGEGDRDAGIFDKVDYFQPFPFVTVQYTAYLPSGKGFASSYAERKAYNYQVGVRQGLEDEDGAVMSMYVGERRQFVVPFELAFKRKLFGNPAPQNQEALLIDVELLKLRPY